MRRQQSKSAPASADRRRHILRAGLAACVLAGIAGCSSTSNWTQAIPWQRKAGDGAVAQALPPDAAPAAPTPVSAAAPAWLPGLAPTAGGGTVRDQAGQNDGADSDAADQGVWAPARPRTAPDDGKGTQLPSAASKAPPPNTIAAAPSGGAVLRGPAASRLAVAQPTSSADAFARRGDELLQTGDIIGARFCYERAVAGGNAAAATSVGKTYDPLYLAAAGVQGLQGDPTQAAAWYRKGIRAGDPEALQRLSALSQTAPE